MGAEKIRLGLLWNLAANSGLREKFAAIGRSSKRVINYLSIDPSIDPSIHLSTNVDVQSVMNWTVN